VQERATNGPIVMSFSSASAVHEIALFVAPQGITAGMRKVGWVGLEPTTNALKRR
jgi:hypothetical protein